MRTLMIVLTMILLGIFTQLSSVIFAGPPVQAYHRTPGCIDGNCVPSRGTNGFHATRWRPWPEGEPTIVKAIPPVGVEPNSVQVPLRDDELDMPFRPNQNSDGSATPSPNDKKSNSIVLPPELRNLTPSRPIEEPRSNNSIVPQSFRAPDSQTLTNSQQSSQGKKSEPLQLRPADSGVNDLPVISPPVLKIRPAGNSQSGLMPEMVPWNDEEKNPIIRQASRINSNLFQQTIRLDEDALPNAKENQTSTIRVQHETPTVAGDRESPVSQAANTYKPHEMAHNTAEYSSSAKAPAMLPRIEAQPLVPINTESTNSGPATVSPLRGISQGNPLRR